MFGVCVSWFTLDIGLAESCALTCRLWALSWDYVSAGEYGGSSGLAAIAGTAAATEVVMDWFARRGHRDGGLGGGDRWRDADAERTAGIGGRLDDSVANGGLFRHHCGESRFVFSDRATDDRERPLHNDVGEVGAHRLA